MDRTLAYVLLVAISIVTIWTGWNNGHLRVDLREARLELSQPTVDSWLPKVELPSGIDGNTVVVAGGGKRQLLYAFSANCRYCQASMPGFARLAQDPVARSQAEFLGIAGVLAEDDVEKSRKFFEKFDVDVPIGFMRDERTARVLRMKQVPAFLVLDSRGQVEYVHMGELVDKEDIERLSSALKKGLRSARLPANQETAS